MQEPRETGFNVLLDEKSVPPEKWSLAPRQVSIALTNQCDLNCSHCYAPKYKAQLDLLELKKWLLELDQNGCFGVGFGGGEPTLHPDLIELCEFAFKQTQLAITMTTHAHNLDLKLIDKLSPYLNFIRVSMDGVNDTYEEVRGRSFHTFLSKLSLLRGKIRFGINIVVNSKTITDIDAAIKIAEEYGAMEFLLLPEEHFGKGSGIDNITRETLQGWVEKYDGKINLSISEQYKTDYPVILPLSKEVGLRSYAHIDASGCLKRTSFDIEGITIADKSIMESLTLLGSSNEEIKL